MSEWTPEGESPELPEGHSTVDHLMAMMPQMLGGIMGTTNLRVLTKLATELYRERWNQGFRDDATRQACVDEVADIMVRMTARLKSLQTENKIP